MVGAPLRIVLLGGTGLVGGALLRGLALEPPGDVAVRALVRRPDRLPAPLPPWLTAVPGDLTAPLPPELFWPGEPQVVIHYATKQIDHDGTGFEAVNVAGTRRLLGALPDGVRGVIYGSTLSVYGSGPQRGEPEEALAVRPDTALGRTRAAAEAAVLAAMEARGASALCLRPRFLVGRGDQHTLPGLLRLTRRGRTVASGEQRFSVIDVDDYARVIVLLARDLAERSDPWRRPLHVGYRRPVSLAEIQGALAAAHGLALPTRRIRLPRAATAILSALPSRWARTQAIRYRLFALDHFVGVDALAGLVGEGLVGRDPLAVLAAAATDLG